MRALPLRISRRFLSEYKARGFWGCIDLILKLPRKLLRNKTYSEMLQLSSNAQKFQEIYDKNVWQSDESASGLSSEFQYTESIRSWLTENIPKYNVREIVDAPCGDFNWMKYVVQDLEVKYTGLDIIESVIERNKSSYETDNVRFAPFDLCSEVIPDTDLIICRDCLFHLSFSDISDVLRNFSRSNYKFLLTTTHVTGPDFANYDIVSGDFRYIDLLKPPFSFDKKAVLSTAPDSPPDTEIAREMILLAKRDVPTSFYLGFWFLTVAVLCF